MATYIDENTFHKATRSLGWHDRVNTKKHIVGEKEFELYSFDRVCSLNNNKDFSIEEFLDALISTPYVRGEKYLVSSLNLKNNAIGIAEFFNSDISDYKFCSMCFFPKVSEVDFALPIASVHNLPEHLWCSREELPGFYGDNATNVKNNDRLVYINHSEEIETCYFERRATFGKPYQSRISKFIKVTDLSHWLKNTKEGQAFYKSEINAIIAEKLPRKLEMMNNGTTGKDIVSQATAAI